MKTVLVRDILPQFWFIVTTPGVEPGDPKIIAPQATAFTNFAMWPQVLRDRIELPTPWM